MSQIVLYVEPQARAVAYVLLPVIILFSAFSESGITFRKHFKVALLLHALAIIWMLIGFFALAQIISVEQGNPVVRDGIIFDIASKIAN